MFQRVLRFSLLLALPALLVTAASPTVFAADEDDDDELFQEKSTPTGTNAGVPNSNTFDDEDDDDMPSFVSSTKAKEDERNVGSVAAIQQTTKMPLDVTGKEVLADNWSPSIAFTDTAAVVVDIPVLFARSKEDFDGVAYWLVAEVYADGKKVSESRVFINSDAIAAKGPSVQFFRLFTPVAGSSGTLEVRIGKASSAAAKPTALFVRSVNFKL